MEKETALFAYDNTKITWEIENFGLQLLSKSSDTSVESKEFSALFDSSPGDLS
jgi:hypothetical protein